MATANDSGSSASDLVAGFFSNARAVYVGEKKHEVLDANDIVKIAADPAACADFMRRFAKDTQDNDFRKLIVDYMQSIADNLEDMADKSEIDAQTIDKVGLPVALSVTGVGIAAIVASGGAAIPIVAACGGLFCLAAAGVGGLKIRHAILKRKVVVRQIKKLMTRLG
jgi:hypothetical protein